MAGELDARDAVRAIGIETGEPQRRKKGFFRYCVIGGGKYMAGFGRKRAKFLLTSNPGFDTEGVRRLTPKRQARRRLDGERELFRTSKTIVWAVEKDDHTLLYGPSGSFVGHPYTLDKVPYDRSELLPVARVSNTVVVLAASVVRRPRPCRCGSRVTVRGP